MLSSGILKEENEPYIMRPYVDLKADFAFKQMFGQTGSEEILIAFLNAILGSDDQEAISSVDLLNTDMEREYRRDKKAVLDLLARTQEGTLIHVEIQMTSKPDMASRLLYYWSRIYAKQLESNHPYSDLKRTITILISNTDLIEQTDKYHSVFELLEREMHYRLTDRMELHVIELNKLSRLRQRNEADPWSNKDIRWLSLLSAVEQGVAHTELIRELEAIAMSEDAKLLEAFERWEDMSRDPKVWVLYEMWHKARMDEGALRYEVEQSKAEVERSKAVIEQSKAEVERSKAEIEQSKAEIEQNKAVIERSKAEIEQRKAEAERARAEAEELRMKLSATARKLSDMGMAIDEIAQTMALTVEETRALIQ